MTPGLDHGLDLRILEIGGSVSVSHARSATALAGLRIFENRNE
jgi:hypothetical protein